MKKQWFGVLVAIAMFLMLIPASAAFASGDTKWIGTIESLPATPGWVGDWIVSGKTVHVSTATKIKQEHGQIAVGATVQAEGYLQADGSLNATEIETKAGAGGGGQYEKFYGVIESLPATPGWVGDWTVSGRIVHVSSTTYIKTEKGQPAVGVNVEVEGYKQPDGSNNATKIETKSGSGGGGQSEKFYGVIESLPATPGWVGDWTVSGRVVHVTGATRIKTQKGQPAVGVNVEVEGYKQPDGSNNAKKIETKSGNGNGNFKLKGIIESLPNTADYTGDWVVSGKTIHVTSATRLEFKNMTPAIGRRVEVKGTLLADNTVNASKIELKK
ncbi:MAG: hypothetical protein HY741_06680 [Chloroflexi bacterium]|nr:hypothetical protein [Chloroflexota bacterium]